MKNYKFRYLEKLSELYPNIALAATEIINLKAILNLPKGTEHFVSDLHGEHEAFFHVLKNGSGSVRIKIDEIFGYTLSNADKRDLATLIYYPREKMKHLLSHIENVEDKHEWYKLTLFRLISLCKAVSSKYTRSKVRKALPPEFLYVIEELITETIDSADKTIYYNVILDTIIDTKRAEAFISAMCKLIKRLVVDHLHIVGDIYDRGSGPHHIMDRLLSYHSLDIQWGNHDVVWMGAAAGQHACIANVIRFCARYGNLDILKEGYGINLLPLASYAMHYYKDDPCDCFKLKTDLNNDREDTINLQMHKAISILQFKLEGNLIQKYPQFELDNRNLLHRIDYEHSSITIDGKVYAIKDTYFPTVDRDDPYKLTIEEEIIMHKLEQSFLHSDKLQSHVNLLLSNGGLYKVYNNNLLYHGCILLDEEGNIRSIKWGKQEFSGRDWYEFLDSYIRKGFCSPNDEERKLGKDIMWYVWLHPNSPLFGKDKMATFERYLIDDQEAHIECKNPYYRYYETEAVIDNILQSFGLNPNYSRIINGHVPVKVKEGESPIKCNGKLIVIDGGFAKAYQHETGIAGYTLIYNSRGIMLAAHEPFTTTENAILTGSDIYSQNINVVINSTRQLVQNTDDGIKIKESIAELNDLLDAYRNGSLTEKY